MRILLAHDGSAGSDTARAFMAGRPWPSGTTVDVIRVIEPFIDVFGMSGMPVADLVDPDQDTGLDEERRDVAAIAAGLTTADVTASGALVVGRPATTILDHARRTAVDLIVIGSRGRGPIASMVLGSVSAEVVDRASCPVLVVRHAACASIVAGVDEGPVGDAIAETLCGWQVFGGSRITLVGVAPSPIPAPGTLLAGASGMPLDWYQRSAAEAHASLAAATDGVADRLRACGFDAEPRIEVGDPAARILATASDSAAPADLIVVGSEGLTGLARAMLGSVSRNVLLHAPCSVLVLRGRG